MGRRLDSPNTPTTLAETDVNHPLRICNDLALSLIRASSNFDIDIDVSSVNFHDIQSMQSSINDLAKDSDSDWSAKSIIESYKRNPTKFVQPFLRKASVADPAHIFHSVLEIIRSRDNSPEHIDALVKVVEILSESQLVGLRFVAVCAAAAILGTICPHQRLISLVNRVVQIVVKRTRDTMEIIRKLSGQDIICESMDLIGIISDDTLCSVIQSLLADHSRGIRLRTVTWISKQLLEKTETSRLSGLIDRWRESFLRCCFDTDVSVQVCALRLVSNPRIGERLLGEDEAAFQRISNLIWFVDTGYHTSHEHGMRVSADPVKVSREALVFINNHIFASPGLLAQGNDESKIAAVIEFLVQYSDSFAHNLCDRFTGTLISYFLNKKVQNAFIHNSDLFVSCLRSYNDHYGATQSSPSNEIETMEKLCTGLELLSSVLRISLESQARAMVTRSLCEVLAAISHDRECQSRDFSHVSARCITRICSEIRESVAALPGGVDVHPVEVDKLGCQCSVNELREGNYLFWSSRAVV